MIAIEKPIARAEVLTSPTVPTPPPNKALQRPEILHGSTYKITTPHSQSAIYVTINDIVSYRQDGSETRRPFEIFINSREMDHFQWIVSLTRLISALLRDAGKHELIIDELRSVYDPKGGYFKKGGKYMPSIAAEISYILEQHCQMIENTQPIAPDAQQQQNIQAAREKLKTIAASSDSSEMHDGYPAMAIVCPSCTTRALVILDGCQTCLHCGASKCG